VARAQLAHRSAHATRSLNLVPSQAQIYQQQQEIAAELRRIRVLAVAQEAQTARYAAAVERVDAALRELGDADNYM